MPHAVLDISTDLRRAREARGISQRELSRLTGVPQGHISKIESGAVDIRVSSLIALARALDLEVTLVPRKAVPAVQSIARQSEAQGLRNLENIQKFSTPPVFGESSRLRPAYTLDDENGDE